MLVKVFNVIEIIIPYL